MPTTAPRPSPPPAPRRPRPPLLPTAVACCVLALPAHPALAWGRLGHRVAARLTEGRLTPAARAAIRELLEPEETLADAATWADEHRRDVPGSGPWHYVNVPITAGHYDPKFCPESGCVVSKLEEYRKVLADPHAPRPQRRQALRLVVHFVQDLHQPMHVGDRNDKGGNDLQLQFFGEGTNLHRLWDSGLFERARPGRREGESEWVRELEAEISPEEADRWARNTSVVSWADESLAAARRAYCFPNSDDLLRPGSRLGRAYEEANLPIARERVEQAAVRLAALLNSVLN